MSITAHTTLRQAARRLRLPALAAATAPALAATALALAATAPAATTTATGEGAAEPDDGPAILSMSALAFSPDGVLFIGDGKAGAVVALDLTGAPAAAPADRLQVHDVETKVAALVGTGPADVLIHDLAVHPVGHDVYLAVSRSHRPWTSPWVLPNDLADATVLLRVDAGGHLHEVPLHGVASTRAALPNPVDPGRRHRWKEGVDLRADTITDMAFENGRLWIAGLSNEAFASTLWRVPYPFGGESSATTLEVFHGAHGEWETHAPIRTFVPYRLADATHMLAAYLCTPLVTFPTGELRDGQHVKGRTVAEFGSGNYPLDMVVYRKQDGRERLLIANSNLPFLIVDPEDVASFDGAITGKVDGYTAGVPVEYRSGMGVQQMDAYGDGHVVALRRLPGGTMDLVAMDVRRF